MPGLEKDLSAQAQEVNGRVEKHERIDAVIVCTAWTIENGVLTPTLKIRRDEVEARFGERAKALAHDGAVSGQLLVEWAD